MPTKTYTPDEYRQMVERRQFGHATENGCDFYGWLLDYDEEDKVYPFKVQASRMPGSDGNCFWAAIFTPCEEPKELEA